MKKIIYISSLLFLSVMCYGQIGKDLEDDFLKFQQEEQQNFKKYKDDRDEEFANFLKQDWILTKTSKAKKSSYTKPKPTILPKAKKKKQPNTTSQKIGNIKTSLKKTPLKKVNLPNPKPIAEDKKTPFHQLNINFYNTPLAFSYDKKFKFYLDNYTEKSIAKYWEQMSTTQYYTFLKQTLFIKNKHQLNDWAYCLMLTKIAKKLYQNSSKSEQNLFVWYFLTKAGYQCNVARINNNIGLLAPFKNKIYQKPFITIDQKKYYIITPYQQGYKVYTYKNKYPNTNLVLDLNLYEPILLGNGIKNKVIEFKNGKQIEKLSIAYQPSNIRFYQDILHSDFSLYFEASVNKTTENSLLSQLKAIIKNQTKEEALNTILHFVQLGFEYKTDKEQFGFEKYFFVEELFHYQYSDCEDRSILFSYLTRKLLNLKVIGLEFPGHLATAVLLNKNVNGDYVTYKNKKYLICDPTYINANIGVAMPRYKKANITIIELL